MQISLEAFAEFGGSAAFGIAEEAVEMAEGVEAAIRAYTWALAHPAVYYDQPKMNEQPSYASNEVTINWNVTLFALSAALDAQ